MEADPVIGVTHWVGRPPGGGGGRGGPADGQLTSSSLLSRILVFIIKMVYSLPLYDPFPVCFLW